MESRFRNLDAALIQARRLFEVPAMVTDDGRRVEASTLLILAALEQLEANPTISDIAAWLDVSHSTASRLVTRAERAGQVRRTPCPSDRREQRLSATAQGRDLTERADHYRRARLSRLLQDWTDQEVDTLSDLLARLARTATNG